MKCKLKMGNVVLLSFKGKTYEKKDSMGSAFDRSCSRNVV